MWFYSRMIQRHIHTGWWSLVNWMAQVLTRHYIRGTWILMRWPVGLEEGIGLYGDRCISKIPRQNPVSVFSFTNGYCWYIVFTSWPTDKILSLTWWLFIWMHICLIFLLSTEIYICIRRAHRCTNLRFKMEMLKCGTEQIRDACRDVSCKS